MMSYRGPPDNRGQLPPTAAEMANRSQYRAPNGYPSSNYSAEPTYQNQPIRSDAYRRPLVQQQTNYDPQLTHQDAPAINEGYGRPPPTQQRQGNYDTRAAYQDDQYNAPVRNEGYGRPPPASRDARPAYPDQYVPAMENEGYGRPPPPANRARPVPSDQHPFYRQNNNAELSRGYPAAAATTPLSQRNHLSPQLDAHVQQHRSNLQQSNAHMYTQQQQWQEPRREPMQYSQNPDFSTSSVISGNARHHNSGDADSGYFSNRQSPYQHEHQSSAAPAAACASERQPPRGTFNAQPVFRLPSRLHHEELQRMPPPVAAASMKQPPFQYRSEENGHERTPSRPAAPSNQFQHVNARQARAPRDYEPLQRHIEDIFEEEAQDQNLASIHEGDADIEVIGVSNPPFFQTWDKLALDPQLMENIRKSNYVHPRKVQQCVIPCIFEGKSLKVEAETASGKTAAYLIPVIQMIIEEYQSNRPVPTDGPIALILTPTRELTKQIYQQALKFADGTPVTVAYCFGQYGEAQNLQNIKKGCNILVACLGRLMGFLAYRHFTMKHVKQLIVDETDRLLSFDDENSNELIKFMEEPTLPPKHRRQTMLFSSTLSNPLVEKFACRHLDGAQTLSLISTMESNARVRYEIVAVPTIQKKAKYLLTYLEEAKQKNGGVCPRTLIFVNSKIRVDQVAVDVTQHGFPATTIHSERTQDLRDIALKHFRTGEASVIVGTDIMMRGISLPYLDLVINYEIPDERTTFINRCGRTGRTHIGTAATFYCQAMQSDVNMASILDGVIRTAGQVPPRFLLDGCTNDDFKYEMPAAAPAPVHHRNTNGSFDSGLVENEPPIPDYDVDNDW